MSEPTEPSGFGRMLAGSRSWPLAKPRWYHHLILFAYLGGIYALSSIPGQSETPGVAEEILGWVAPGVQNLLHVPLFFGLCWVSCRSLSQVDWSAARRVAVAMGVSVAYGALDELHQLAVPGRFASYTDALLNAVGALGAAWWILSERRGPRWWVPGGEKS